MGKIGLAISPMQPNVLYAAIELERKKASELIIQVEAMSDAVSGEIGPHYYQELVASPMFLIKFI